MEELIERVPALEIIEERLDGHSGAYKDRSPSKDIRVAMNDRCLRRHDLEYTLNARGVPNESRLSCGALLECSQTDGLHRRTAPPASSAC
jgi:hypothetical protein